MTATQTHKAAVRTIADRYLMRNTRDMSAPGRIATRVAIRPLLGLILLCNASTIVASTPGAERFCRSVDEETSPWLAENRELSLPAEMTSVGALIDHLRHQLSIPISWIEAQPGEILKFEAEPSALDDLLRSVANQHPEYLCEVRSGRLILRSRAEIFDRVIMDVDLVERYRFVAVSEYIEHLRVSGGGFETWTRPLVGGRLESPLVSEKVTLTPRAPMLHHLVQLLGRLPKTYFTIPAPAGVPRTIYISEAP